MTKPKIYVQYGMKRSGNHAVSNALQPVLTDHYFNNIVPMGPIYEGRDSIPILETFEHWLFSPNLVRVPGATAEAWPVMRKVYTSFEDLPVTLDAFCGDAPTRILVIRSFENMMSSRIRKGFKAQHSAYPTSVNTTMLRIIETWKQHARSYLRLEGPDRTAILFDEWVINPVYRNKISSQLGVEIIESCRQVVSDVGGGSSFDGVTFNGNSERMRVLQRADQLTQEEKHLLYCTMKDKEVRELSKNISNIDPLKQI